ncbi:MAG: ECF transporter S component [Monoglobus pectinilyticus]|uniref:ECF transporter S component n=1 Tax=Monoglobus pectinilyticus TaxID=1981510 RepID=UPI00300EEB73
MELFSVKDLNFSYTNNRNNFALKDVSFKINSGEFITLCGKSGCGKTSLLRQLKTTLSPSGFGSGSIKYCGNELEKTDSWVQASEIGFVMQKAESQIVTDKVWHEMAFGLESLGYDTDEIRLRVSEMASFFGLQSWFYKDTNTLSGGQKQLLSLASVMVLEPKILILDEPTAQLDPISAGDFMQMLLKINCEFGTAILVSAHNLEEVVPISDRIIVMENGRIIADNEPQSVILNLRNTQNEMFSAMPSPAQIYASVDRGCNCPLTVREGRDWISTYVQGKEIKPVPVKKIGYKESETVLKAKNIWFRYEKRDNDILKNISLSLHSGEWQSLVGSTGVGKTTFLSILSGTKSPYRGNVDTMGNRVCLLPQDPTTIFEKDTVMADLVQDISQKDESYLQNIINLCDLSELLYMHPYDLSGGEQQRAALAKVLLKRPRILLLDEPTKGLDALFKKKLAGILLNLKIRGISIIMVSHDIEFCAQYSDNCAFLFDGEIISKDEPRAFFSGNNFYTTSANRIARHIIPNAITTDDVIYAIGGSPVITKSSPKHNSRDSALPPLLTPVKTNIITDKGSKGSVFFSVLSLLLIPLCIFLGMKFIHERPYYYISIAIILLSIIPFIVMFEGRKPQARELVTIAVLCTIGVIGKIAFYMIPQFKPTVAIIIISAMALGSQRGFLIGVITAFVSNIFLGQGPWTPWQMFACGLIGFISGFMYKKEALPKTTVPICIFGFLITLLIYGGIMNPAALIMANDTISMSTLAAYYISGIPYDIIHAASTVIFLIVLAKPMLTKLDRVKKKYGLLLKGRNSYN